MGLVTVYCDDCDDVISALGSVGPYVDFAKAIIDHEEVCEANEDDENDEEFEDDEDEDED